MVEHGYAVVDATPLADQHAPGAGPRVSQVSGDGLGTILGDPVEEPLRCWLQASRRPFLQPVRQRSHQQGASPVGRWSVAHERRPALP